MTPRRAASLGPARLAARMICPARGLGLLGRYLSLVVSSTG